MILAKTHIKITNQRDYYIHYVTNQLIKSENQTFVVENLNVKGMIKNHKLARSIADASWSKFLQTLSYKCDWAGKNIIEVDRFYPSSKLCSVCGFKNDSLTLKDRAWVCPECGSKHDRDINAAVNLRNYGLNKHAPVMSGGGGVENKNNSLCTTKSAAVAGSVKRQPADILF
jgi:putative transposase